MIAFPIHTGELESVETMATDLAAKTYIDKIELTDWYALFLRIVNDTWLCLTTSHLSLSIIVPILISGLHVILTSTRIAQAQALLHWLSRLRTWVQLVGWQHLSALENRHHNQVSITVLYH